jgi:hypothetical protein
MQKIEFPKFKNYKDQFVNYIQPKHDGHLTKVYVDENGIITCLTKNDKDITTKLWAINHISSELCRIPPNSVLFAELHCPDVLATSVPTLLNGADERLQLTFFAAPLFNGQDWENELLLYVVKELKKYKLNVVDTSIVIGIKDEDQGDFQLDEVYKQNLLKEAIKNKLEGWVLKEKHTEGWYKLKPIKTLDAFVIATQMSFSSTHYGGLQSIHIAVIDDKGKMIDLGNVGSGFELEYRKSLDSKAKRDSLLDKVCEVEYDSIAANGKLRFPRFKRWRTDKNKNQCTTEQFK